MKAWVLVMDYHSEGLKEPFTVFLDKTEADEFLTAMKRHSYSDSHKLVEADVWNAPKRVNGRAAGGRARAAALTPARRTEIAKHAADTRWNGTEEKKTDEH